MKTTIFLLVLALGGIGCERSGSTSTDSAANAPVKPGMKVCFNCGGAAKLACVAPGCKNGMADCPGPCLKLSKGTWEHMHVDGHSDNDVWQRDEPGGRWS
jgi:hypothetical protein